MDSWKLVYEGYDPEQERLREALCTLGNGRFATRGAAPETRADAHHYPGTYLGGLYDRLTSEVAGEQVTNESLVNLPSWLPLTFRPDDGDWFHVDAVELLEYRQELDLRLGILRRDLRCRDAAGRTTRIVQRRLVHMGEPQLAALEMEITPEDWEGRLTIRSALEGRVINAGVDRYGSLRGDHLVPLQTGRLTGDTIYLKVRTKQSDVRVALAARTRVHGRGKSADLALDRRTQEEDAYVGQEIDLELARGRTVVVEKVVSLHSSREPAITECGHEARRDLEWAGSFAELLESHAVIWDQLWQRFHLHTDGEGRIEQILNLHTFHLLQTVNHNSIGLDMGVPARGWHGEAYRGHIFWDELFIFPFLNLRLPELTRSLLMYRYRRLPEARRNARLAGYAGALFPWQSGSNGREESQRVHLNPRSGNWLPDPTRLQRHIDAAIAYNVWQHYQATGDLEFMSAYGAEMILEIARFWASLATWNEELERYEILGVMGPDEYHTSYGDREHPGLDNNAYTNVMAVWVLQRAGQVLDLLPERRRAELRERLQLGDEELALWERISRRMRICFHGDGVISQFEGYERLAEFDWEGYRRKYGNIQRLDRILEAEDDSPNHYKASKQADVLMLFYLLSAEELRGIFERLGYELDGEAVRRNVDYYLDRTSHGSTLSGVVHSWVLARSERTRSWEFFEQALMSDVTDIQGGTTPEGIHLGAMAGTVDLVQRCFPGIELREDVLWFNPVLPAGLHSLKFTIHYRQAREIGIEITHDRLRLKAMPSGHLPISVNIAGREHRLEPGQEQTFSLERQA